MNIIAFDSFGGYLVRLLLGLNNFLLHFHKSLNLQDSQPPFEADANST